MSSDLCVAIREDGRLLEIVLNRGERGNALSSNTFRGLSDAVRHAESDGSIGAILIRSNIGAFCMGGDVSDGRGNCDPRYSAAVHDFTERWLSRSLPSLAIVDGGAQAYGCALALSSDLVLATESAWFSLPELQHGLVPAYAVALLDATGHRAIGARMMWQGTRFTAECLARLEHNVLSFASGAEATHGLTTILNGWMGVDVDSLRRAKRFVNGPAATANSEYLARARKVLQESLASADEDPGKAQSYLQADEK